MSTPDTGKVPKAWRSSPSLATAGCPPALTKVRLRSTPNLIWKSTASLDGQQSPYQSEWNDLVDAIRNDKPYNEALRGVEASLVTCMGRMAAHTGRIITFDDMLHCEHEFAPDVDKLTVDSPAPLLAGRDGKYPVPQPGITTKREYQLGTL